MILRLIRKIDESNPITDKPSVRDLEAAVPVPGTVLSARLLLLALPSPSQHDRLGRGRR